MCGFYASNSVIPTAIFAFLQTYLNSSILHCIITISSHFAFPKSSENISCYVKEVYAILTGGRIMKANLKLAMNKQSAQSWPSLNYHCFGVRLCNGTNSSKSRRDRFNISNHYQLRYATWPPWTNISLT